MVKLRNFKFLAGIGFNPRIFAWLVLFGVIFAIIYGTPYLFYNNKKVVASNTPIVIYRNVATPVYVYPTPDNHIYFAGEYQNGTRLLQHPFSWIRYNALFKADMKITTIVYDYMYFDKLHWFNPEDYKYVEMLPHPSSYNLNGEGNQTKFLLIFVYVVMDDKGGDDTRMWSIPRDTFAIWTQNNTYSPLNYSYQIRFRELENTVTFNKESKIESYKSIKQYSSTYPDMAGEYADEQYYLRGGTSNAMNGFLIYTVPKNSTPENTLVLAQFRNFGFSSWKLTS